MYLRLVTDKTTKNKPRVDYEPRSARGRAVNYQLYAGQYTVYNNIHLLLCYLIAPRFSDGWRAYRRMCGFAYFDSLKFWCFLALLKVLCVTKVIVFALLGKNASVNCHIAMVLSQ